ncbi:hypothetical protein VIGAN_09007600 [Vigna angularis var. angularis]|uniref:Uncharacterized protein n=1 Tax=Vigna angularis var. angularis TaxID=157739 RepID=A0A0S3SVG8_PHAAN|nr:hypothetical protein VIGAN_09007600 [Vigna angularis var. angularis]
MSSRVHPSPLIQPSSLKPSTLSRLRTTIFVNLLLSRAFINLQRNTINPKIPKLETHKTLILHIHLVQDHQHPSQGQGCNVFIFFFIEPASPRERTRIVTTTGALPSSQQRMTLLD